MKKIFYIMIYIIFASCFEVKAAEQASINIDLQNYSIFPRDEFFGGFIEFLEDYVNGPCGMWAEELRDRGFDVGIDKMGADTLWSRASYPAGNSLPKYVPGGYNEKGDFYIENKSNFAGGRSEISQIFFYNDTVSYSGYSFLKSNVNNGKGNLLITNKEGNDTIVKIQIPDKLTVWTRFDFKIPKNLPYKQLKLIYSVSDSGEIDIDEASIVPDNNVLGVRSEWHALLKKLKPGNLRWPGGYFANFKDLQIENVIGDKNHRRSPLLPASQYRPLHQRMDFGPDEYLQYCELLGTTPVISLNYRCSSPDSAMRWIRYMTADTSDYWGHLRYENGREKPYKIKFFEIGNEEWTDSKKYGSDAREYYDSIKAYDPELKVILGGDVYRRTAYFDTLYAACGGKMDYYSAHPGLNVENTRDESEAVKILLGGCDFTGLFSSMEKDLQAIGAADKIKNCVTEVWTQWDSWLTDTSTTNETFLMGLSESGVALSLLEYADKLNFSCRTIGINFIKKYYDWATGEREIYGEPSFDALCMINRHLGSRLHRIITDSELSSYQDWVSGKYSPYVQAAATSDDNSLFIAILNRDPAEDREVKIDILKKFSHGLRYEYWCDSLLARKSREHQNPFGERIVPLAASADGTITLPKHSFTILEFALADSISAVDDHAVKNLAAPFPNPVLSGDRLFVPLPEDFLFSEISVSDASGRGYSVRFSQAVGGIMLDVSRLCSGEYYARLDYISGGVRRYRKFEFVKK